jgi:dihydrofolate reductase
VAREIVPSEIHAMKAEPGKDILVGGAELMRAFSRYGLIDDYQLVVEPVVIGGGKPLFDENTRLSLNLLETRPFASGAVLLRYAPAKPME